MNVARRVSSVLEGPSMRRLRASASPLRSNWAGNVRWSPEGYFEPASTEEAAEIVRRAAAATGRVKVVGGGHSFTAAAATGGIQLSLDRMRQVIAVDRARRQVTVEAGIRLWRLNDELAMHGLAMPNLGDIDRQSIAGAIATATHGTGRRFGNLATTVVGFTIVAGTGDVLRCDAGTEHDVWSAGRVGLGALGIITEVTLQVVPAFNLRARETIEALDGDDGVLANVGRLSRDNDHFEFYWMPGTRRCQVKRNERTDEPADPPSRGAYLRDKWLAENLGFGVVCRVGRRMPSLTPRVAKLVVAGASERELIDRSDRVFCSPRRVRFVEMEYGIPFESLPEAFERVRRLTRTLTVKPLFPIEVRVSAGDDIPLSTASGRDSGWIAVHQYRGVPYEEYFHGVERIMNDYDGRPHWGKLHFQSAATLAPRYPRWNEFIDVRRRLDPGGVFRNDHLDRVLGPIGAE